MKEIIEEQKEKTTPIPSIGVDGEQSIHNNNIIIPEINPIDKGLEEKNSTVSMICLSDVQAEEVRWLWHPYIPFGKLTIMQGDPGEGKTFLILGITSYLTQGKALYNATANEPISVIYQTAEDGLADTIKPRLEELGADCRRVFVIDEGDDYLSFTDQRIRTAITENNAKLLILDPLQAFLGSGVDMNRANEVRPVFKKIGKVAEETGCAIVMIGHMNKSGGKSTYRSIGSMDIVASVRSVLIVGRDPDNPESRIIAHSKSNLAPLGTSLRFSICDGLVFDGESPLTADQLIGFSGSSRNVKEEAKVLLKQILMIAPVEANSVYLQGKEANISKRTIDTAKKELGIISNKVADKWLWSLPTSREKSLE
ncbi:MAG: AAA family ATPase [Eubacteriales bacterium]